MFHHFRAAIVIFVLLSLVTGVVYPLVVTGIAQTLFPRQAQGSLIERDGEVLGSKLIGQQFDGQEYFWGRLSATGPDALQRRVVKRLEPRADEPGPVRRSEGADRRLESRRSAEYCQVPVDLVTSSGSGLDPHISPAAAAYQVPRVAKARNLPETQVRELVAKHTAGRTLGMLGEPRVNVLLLNLELDSLKKH